MTQEDFNQAVLAVTSGPDWDVVKQGLANDIYQVQAGALDAKSWDAVCEARGFAAGLAYISNLRETTMQAMEIANANV
jgi:hypothetical protein